MVRAVYSEATAKRFIEDAIFLYEKAIEAADELEKKRYSRLAVTVIPYYLECLSCYLYDDFVNVKLDDADINRITKRLLNKPSTITDDFVTFAGEVIATWAEEPFAKHTIVRPPKPHDSTPCFDAVALGHDDNKNLYLCFVQAKTTEANIVGNANSPAVDLGKLDSGDFDIELAGAIEEIAERQPNPIDKERVLKAFVDLMCRCFRIVVVHGVKAPCILLGQYCDQIQGA